MPDGPGVVWDAMIAVFGLPRLCHFLRRVHVRGLGPLGGGPMSIE